MKTKNKKVWLLGQTREFNIDYRAEYMKALGEDIAKYFEGQFGDCVPVRVFCINNSLSINIGLTFNDAIEDNTLPQSIGLMLFGETEHTKAEYPLPTAPSFGGYFNVRTPMETFIEYYKKNVKFYKATPVKNVEIENSDSIGLIVRLIY